MLFHTKTGVAIAYEQTGPADSRQLVIWGHGWGQNRKAFLPMAESLASRAQHILIDFPGFGESPAPQTAWDTAAYADAVAELIAAQKQGRKLVWVGHSFGCRVGVQLAARHGELIDGLFLIAAAGLLRQRNIIERIKINSRIFMFKTLKHIVPLFGMSVDELRAKFGSADYRNAGPMRPIFLNVIREDLSNEARRVKCLTELVYGSDDTETPVEIGERYAALMPRAALTALPGQDHYSVLGAGRHPVVKRLGDFLEMISSVETV